MLVRKTSFAEQILYLAIFNNMENKTNSSIHATSYMLWRILLNLSKSTKLSCEGIDWKKKADDVQIQVQCLKSQNKDSAMKNKEDAQRILSVIWTFKYSMHGWFTQHSSAYLK